MTLTKRRHRRLEAQLLVAGHLVVTVTAGRPGARGGYDCTNNMAYKRGGYNVTTTQRV